MKTRPSRRSATPPLRLHAHDSPSDVATHPSPLLYRSRPRQRETRVTEAAVKFSFIIRSPPTNSAAQAECSVCTYPHSCLRIPLTLPPPFPLLTHSHRPELLEGQEAWAPPRPRCSRRARAGEGQGGVIASWCCNALQSLAWSSSWSLSRFSGRLWTTMTRCPRRPPLTPAGV